MFGFRSLEVGRGVVYSKHAVQGQGDENNNSLKTKKNYQHQNKTNSVSGTIGTNRLVTYQYLDNRVFRLVSI